MSAGNTTNDALRSEIEPRVLATLTWLVAGRDGDVDLATAMESAIGCARAALVWCDLAQERQLATVAS